MLTLLSFFLFTVLVDHFYAQYRNNPFATWG